MAGNSEYRAAQATLDADIVRIEGQLGVGASTAPSAKVTRGIVRDILSLPSNSDTCASKEEIALFGKVCQIVSIPSRTWLNSTFSTLKHDEWSNDSIAPRRLLSRLKQDTSPKNASRRTAQRSKCADTGPMGYHNDLVTKLQQCIPTSDRLVGGDILEFFNTSIGWDGAPVTGLTPAFDAGGWMILRACQHDIYALADRTRPSVSCGALANTEAGTRTFVDARLEEIASRVEQLPWRIAAGPRRHNSDSLFTRLLLNVALNRFVHVEMAFERLSKVAHEIQSRLLEELQRAGVVGLYELIPASNADRPEQTMALIQGALRESIAKSKHAITAKTAAHIHEQAEAILQSCSLREFEGEIANGNLTKDPKTTLAAGRIILTWTYLNQVKIPNEDPGINSKSVRLISMDSTIERNGHLMVLMRRLVSSLLAGNQLTALSLPHRRLQHHYTVAVRRIAYRAILKDFKGASLHEWCDMLAHHPSTGLTLPHDTIKACAASRLRTCEK